jgi:hypothetical protein
MIIFPTIAICWWNRQARFLMQRSFTGMQKELAPNQLNRKTMFLFYQYITENMRFKKLIEILSLSFEYMSQIQIRRSDEPVLHKLKPLLPGIISHAIG